MEGNTKANLEKKLITILSMDGGGVRGIIPAVVLQFLEKQIQTLTGDKNARIADYFDIISGTSAGGISSTILTVPNAQSRPKYSADDLVDFHMTKWKRIFPPVSEIMAELNWVNHFLGPQYQNANFCQVMEEVLNPNSRLSETFTHVVIPSFDIKQMQPVIFSTYEAKKDKKRDAALKHVSLSTSSAPLVFPPYYFQDPDPVNGNVIEYNMVDGYVVADNPTWVAVTEGLKEYAEEFGKSTASIGKLLILSLGTGIPKLESKYDAQKTSCWGTIQWVYSLQERCRPFADIFQTAATNLVDIQLQCLLKAVDSTENYLRIQKYDLSPDLVPVTNASDENMKKLKEIADELVKEKALELRVFAKKLVEEKRGRVGNLA